MCTTAIGAVVLVGGRSRRMGTPKHTCLLASGITMGEHMAALAATVAGVVLAAGPIAAMDGIDAVPDLDGHTGLGPLAGIEAALASGRAERWVVVPCDMPHLTSELLLTLRDHPTRGAVVLQGAGPLPLRIDTSHLGAVSAALDAGDLAVRDLSCVRNAAVVPVPDHTCIQDVDRPADLG